MVVPARRSDDQTCHISVCAGASLLDLSTAGTIRIRQSGAVASTAYPTAEHAAALELDHVLLAVRDLQAAGSILEDRYGLASIEGGRHPDWGTANRIWPSVTPTSN
jgi:hypothetical protein